MISRYNTFDYKLDTRLNVGFKIDEKLASVNFFRTNKEIDLCEIPCLSIFSQLFTKAMFCNIYTDVVCEMLKEEKNKIQDNLLEDNIETNCYVGDDRLNTNPQNILFSLNNYK